MLQHRILVGRVSDVLICVIAHETFSSSACSSLLPTSGWSRACRKFILRSFPSMLCSPNHPLYRSSKPSHQQETHSPNVHKPSKSSSLPTTTKMQPKTMLSVLSIAIAASARPSPQTSTSSCTANQQEGCCSSIAANGTGFGCIFSTLNPLDPTCTSGQTLACCNAPQTGLVNVECIPITITL